jgi:hypothetical protein
VLRGRCQDPGPAVLSAADADDFAKGMASFSQNVYKPEIWHLRARIRHSARNISLVSAVRVERGGASLHIERRGDAGRIRCVDWALAAMGVNA